jgi:hypothetical protein
LNSGRAGLEVAKVNENSFMSVDLTITDIKTGEDIVYLTVSSLKNFEEFWLPISKNLNLKIIEVFPYDMTYSRADIPIILNELNIFSKVLSSSASPMPYDIKDSILENIQLIQKYLSDLPDEMEVEIRFG